MLWSVCIVISQYRNALLRCSPTILDVVKHYRSMKQGDDVLLKYVSRIRQKMKQPPISD